MPAKAKKVSKKDSKEPKEPSPEDMVTDAQTEMRDSIRLMKQEIVNEKKLLNDFQQQKEKVVFADT
jgi:hypothetical protein